MPNEKIPFTEAVRTFYDAGIRFVVIGGVALAAHGSDKDVDFAHAVDGLWERATLLDFGGFIVRVASIDDLIAMKRAANRPKDQSHVYELLVLKKLIETEVPSPETE